MPQTKAGGCQNWLLLLCFAGSFQQTARSVLRWLLGRPCFCCSCCCCSGVSCPGWAPHPGKLQMGVDRRNRYFGRGSGVGPPKQGQFLAAGLQPCKQTINDYLRVYGGDVSCRLQWLSRGQENKPTNRASPDALCHGLETRPMRCLKAGDLGCRFIAPGGEADGRRLGLTIHTLGCMTHSKPLQSCG